MATSSQSGVDSGPHALGAYRDVQGFFPLAYCDKCGTWLIGRISQKLTSKGKSFYKCQMLEHVSGSCCISAYLWFGCVGHVIWFEFDLWICCLSFADFNGMSILHV